jgi:hypothetical protein
MFNRKQQFKNGCNNPERGGVLSPSPRETRNHLTCLQETTMNLLAQNRITENVNGMFAPGILSGSYPVARLESGNRPHNSVGVAHCNYQPENPAGVAGTETPRTEVGGTK